MLMIQMSRVIFVRRTTIVFEHVEQNETFCFNQFTVNDTRRALRKK